MLPLLDVLSSCVDRRLTTQFLRLIVHARAIVVNVWLHKLLSLHASCRHVVTDRFEFRQHAWVVDVSSSDQSWNWVIRSCWVGLGHGSICQTQDSRSFKTFDVYFYVSERLTTVSVLMSPGQQLHLS